MSIQTSVSSNSFTGLRISDLSFSTGLAVWGFRAVATGHGNCRPVVDGFERALGNYAAQARQAIFTLAIEFSKIGRRRFLLSPPGCLGITHDEVCLIGAIYAAQSSQKEYALAQLVWLLGRSPSPDLSQALQVVAEILRLGNHLVEDPLKLMDQLYPNSNKATQTGNTLKENASVRTLH